MQGIAPLSMQACTAFGLPVIVFWHSRYGLRSLATPLILAIWLSAALGDKSLGEAVTVETTVAGAFSVVLFTTLIWLSLARGERFTSPAKVLTANAATIALRRSFVFITGSFICLSTASLRCRHRYYPA